MDDERRIEDANARKAARTEFRVPIVLRAGAGTGKTAALVSRIVAWILGPGWIKAQQNLGQKESSDQRIARSTLSRVVAITFTEAASAEMAERVAVALHAISVGGAVVGLPSEELCENSTQRARHLLAAIDMLEVRTIHAWCRALLAKYPIEAGIHPAFSVDADGVATATIIRDVVEAGLRANLSGPNNNTLMYLFEQGVNPTDIEAAVGALISRPASIDGAHD